MNSNGLVKRANPGYTHYTSTHKHTNHTHTQAQAHPTPTPATQSWLTSVQPELGPVSTECVIGAEREAVMTSGGPVSASP